VDDVIFRASASRTSRSSRTSKTNMSVTKRDLPEIHVRRETKYGMDPNAAGINYNHVPEEYLLSLSDDSDYCSSDWDFDSDDELDAEDIKKEAMIGYFLISFTTIFMTFLIVAYLQSTSIPLCICHSLHPKYNASAEYSQVQQLCETTHKLNERDEAHCLQLIILMQRNDKIIVEDAFDGSCSIQMMTYDIREPNMEIVCNNGSLSGTDFDNITLID